MLSFDHPSGNADVAPPRAALLLMRRLAVVVVQIAAGAGLIALAAVRTTGHGSLPGWVVAAWLVGLVLLGFAVFTAWGVVRQWRVMHSREWHYWPARFAEGAGYAIQLLGPDGQQQYTVGLGTVLWRAAPFRKLDGDGVWFCGDPRGVGVVVRPGHRGSVTTYGRGHWLGASNSAVRTSQPMPGEPEKAAPMSSRAACASVGCLVLFSIAIAVGLAWFATRHSG